MKKNGLTRLESLVRETVEGSFGRLFGGYLEPMDVATQLVQVMEESGSPSEVAGTFEVSLHPSDYQNLLDQNPQFAGDLAEAAWKLGRRYGLLLTAMPTIHIVQDDALRRHAFHIEPCADGREAPGVDTTQVVGRRLSAEKAIASLKELDAFLIVHGRRHVALDKPLITIGRRPDNDIVLASSSVSRQHAQIRWRFDRFVLYDVSNRGRTVVNGEVVGESILRPGDVIALSDAMLIYGEGSDRGGAQPHDQETGAMNTQLLLPKRS